MNELPLLRAEIEQWHTEFGPDVNMAAKEFDQMQAAFAELKEFIAECEMPMEESFSASKSSEWISRREYLLSNQAGEKLLYRINKAKDLVRRLLNTGYIRTDETRQLWDDVNEFLK